MKPFQFSLQPLRNLREHEEQIVRERYAGALRACERAAERVQGAGVELRQCWSALSAKMAAGVVGDELLRARAWCNVLELRLKERTTELEKARLEVDRFWNDLKNATREREKLDRFFDKRRRAHEQEGQRQEQKGLDELAVQLVHSPVRITMPTNPS